MTYSEYHMHKTANPTFYSNKKFALTNNRYNRESSPEKLAINSGIFLSYKVKFRGHICLTMQGNCRWKCVCALAATTSSVKIAWKIVLARQCSSISLYFQSWNGRHYTVQLKLVVWKINSKIHVDFVGWVNWTNVGCLLMGDLILFFIYFLFWKLSWRTNWNIRTNK